jgi:tetratricopeptide (TPR) repeat protein
LGKYLAKRGMAAEAAAAYQNAIDHAADRVYVANNCQWLVKHYFDAGRVDDALKIATEAAAAYSHAGLETLAQLYEWTNRLPEAETYYKKIRERYESSQELIAFYNRNKERDPAYGRAADGAISALFPRGIEKAVLADFKDPPRDGAMFTSNSPKLQQALLKVGDVVVAIDGSRVHTQEQYVFVRELSNDPRMKLIVWSGAFYREMDVTQRRFDCQLSTFRGR